jgi:predicted nucleic acid-binding Zn ribbon protein
MDGGVSMVDGHIDGADTCVVCGKVIPEGRQVCVICGHKVGQKQTNYDLIRNMSVDELAEFILLMGIGYISGQAPENIKEWLEQEVEE